MSSMISCVYCFFSSRRRHTRYWRDWSSDVCSSDLPSKFYNPIQNYRFVSPSNDVIIRGDAAKSCILDVRAAYQHLAFLAAREGAQLMIKSVVTDVDRKSTRLNSSHANISYAVFCLKKKNN